MWSAMGKVGELRGFWPSEPEMFSQANMSEDWPQIRSSSIEFHREVFCYLRSEAADDLNEHLTK